MTDAPLLSILVISFNTRQMTLDCLHSVFAETQETPIEVIVVDNRSSDGSADAIAAEFPDVRLIRSPENLGFAAANNLAAESAQGRFLLLLNPDTVVIEQGIDRLAAFAVSHPHAGVWGGRTLYEDRSLNPTSCWRRFDLWTLLASTAGTTLLFPSSRLFNPEPYGRWQRDTVREVDIVTGCWLLIERTLWQRLGGFARKYFMYGEDADLCLRARAAGARPLIAPTATIIHFGGGADPYRPAKFVAIFKAKVSLIDDHWPRWQRGIGKAVYPLYPLTRAVAYGVAATILRRESLRTKADLWREVWRRRGEWRHGWNAQP